MSKNRVTTPFLFCNPKSYFWGERSLKLAKKADEVSKKYDIQIFFTCTYADIRLIAENTSHVTVTAQNMDSLKPGRGMGAVLPESLKEAGAKAVVLNHAENQKKISELYACINRAKELGLITIVCADSVTEARAIAELGVDVILAEPTDLIGTGQAADDDYTIQAVKQIKEVDPNVKIMIASGITTPQDCYNVIHLGADGTGSTSGITTAKDPEQTVEDMVAAIDRAMKERG